MAWALEFDGVDDYISTVTDILLTGDFEIRIKFKLNRVQANDFLFSYTEQTTGYVRIINAGQVRIREGDNAGSSTNSFYANLLNDLAINTWYDWTIKRASGTVDITDDLGASLLTSTGTLGGNLKFNAVGRFYNSLGVFDGELESLDVTDNGILVHNYSATASDDSNTGAQPVLVDTVGGNDAVGSGFPQDGSAWVEKDGGAVDLIFSDSEQKPTSDSIAIQNINQLSFLDSLSQPTSDSISLELITELLFSDSLSQPTTDIAALQNITELLLSDSLVQPTSDLTALQNLTQLSFSSSTAQPSSDSVVISNSGQLIFSDSTVQPSSDSMAIELYTDLSFSDSLAQPTTDSINITTQVMPFFGNDDLLLIDNTISYHLIDNTTDYRIK